MKFGRCFFFLIFSGYKISLQGIFSCRWDIKTKANKENLVKNWDLETLHTSRSRVFRESRFSKIKFFIGKNLESREWKKPWEIRISCAMLFGWNYKSRIRQIFFFSKSLAKSCWTLKKICSFLFHSLMTELANGISDRKTSQTG